MLMKNFMRVFFHLLYHPFAFTYDLVAAVVSFGQWKNWGRSILPFIEGTRILELGHGPGHLQRFLLDLKLDPVAIDESAQMGKLARKRIGPTHKLTRGLAQTLPFQTASFDCVISTFPTEYIFDPRTLSEIKRILKPAGRLVVVPAAFPSNRFLKWLYKVTGENPQALDDNLKKRLVAPFTQIGFLTEVQIKEVKSSRVVILVAKK
ncbi:MAG TPA: methyltransferase domain-containing protein [Anaerolineales bacterium]|nr:methyltransferase domain-containing protein [Anaerolineales bacterium]HNB85853.1 methyltransferase domain-containing protein [Anaerolineales bacterium]HNC88315.1 methyltransferase domain-containing protein [Anaerolineales bacterium]HND90915.1 methyltransferase domain-containing protein [Anaerolineales bacterium]HNE67560.1 methyltransferase domain-containing protein [Anaerolineales bacterium]